MPYYPLKCTFQSCSQDFDYFTTPDLYIRSAKDSFRDVRCVMCGSFGTVKRTYPANSAPANITVKGTWGKHASDGLKGKSFYGKEERNRQLASVGRMDADDGDSFGKVARPKSVYKKLPDGSIGKVAPPKPEEAAVVEYDARVFTPKPSELIREYAGKNKGVVDFAGLVEETGVSPKRLQGGIMGAIRQGWLEKSGERVYRLL